MPLPDTGRRRMLPRGLRASDVRPATWTVSDEAEARQILEGMSQGKFRKGLFAKPSLSLKSVGAVPLPTAQHVRQWMSDVGFPVPQPYIVQALVVGPGGQFRELPLSVARLMSNMSCSPVDLFDAALVEQCQHVSMCVCVCVQHERRPPPNVCKH